MLAVTWKSGASAPRYAPITDVIPNWREAAVRNLLFAFAGRQICARQG
jgi:hypothetical protein